MVGENLVLKSQQGTTFKLLTITFVESMTSILNFYRDRALQSQGCSSALLILDSRSEAL
jgi:hypothetical protein